MKPLIANLAVLNEGTLLYPFDTDLCLAATNAYAKWGFTAEAKALVDRSLKATDNDERGKVRDMKKGLEKEASANDRLNPHP